MMPIDGQWHCGKITCTAVVGVYPLLHQATPAAGPRADITPQGRQLRSVAAGPAPA
jgi:hypothetical protein